MIWSETRLLNTPTPVYPGCRRSTRTWVHSNTWSLGYVTCWCTWDGMIKSSKSCSNQLYWYMWWLKYSYLSNEEHINLFWLKIQKPTKKKTCLNPLNIIRSSVYMHPTPWAWKWWKKASSDVLYLIKH